MSSEPRIAVNLRHRIGHLALQAAFSTSAPWTVLFGPSGSGKSTLLRAIAGLLRPDHGSITLNGQVVCDREQNLWIGPRARPSRWSAQTATLFPHMTIARNLAFGLTQSRSLSASDRRDAVAQALHHFRLTTLSARYPAQLSGGEQQRVAVARTAIGARGKVLLLDEPFTGLDSPVRDRLIEDLRAWLGDTPVLSVTHSVAEALLLQAHVVRLADGKVAAQGPAALVLKEERERLLTILQ